MTSLVMALLVLFSLLPLQSFATEADDIPPATTEETTPGEEGAPDPEESLDPTESIPPETTPQETELLTGLQKEAVKFYLLSGKARSIVDQAVTKVGIPTGETWFDVWYLNKWSGYWAVWGSWWYGELSYFEFASGAIGYCIQPYNMAAAMNSDRVPITWDDIITPYASSSDGFEESKAQGISLAMAYGSPNNGDASVSGCYATAAMIWAIACGHIRPDGTIRDEETPFLHSLEVGFQDDPECYAEIEAKYNELLACLKNHGKIPSFTAGSRAELTDEHTVMLQYDADADIYTASVTDTNGILKYYNYQSAIEGLTFEKADNTLTITATPAAVAQLGSSGIINSRGHEVTVGPDSVIVWNTEGNDAQTMVTMNVAADPVPSYFTLAVSKGEMEIVKITEDGKNLAGWQFGIYSDEACTSLISGPHASGSDGTITVSGLDVGAVWVKEIGHSDAAIDALYHCEGTNPQQVTVQSGQTATVSFRNNLRLGTCEIVKETTNGGNKAGWHFEVKDASGKVVGYYITDATGIIILDLEPGTYTVTETDGAYPYWINDPTPTKTVTVKAGETSTVTFQNQWYGKAQIIKTATNGGSVEGWEFTIKDSDSNLVGTYTTDAAGTILVDLNPGTYTIQETNPQDPYWYCDPVPQTVTVKAGETVSVPFENRWIGKIKIIKILENAETGSLKDWLFSITDSGGVYLGTYGTDDQGTICVDMEPGTYIITEILEEDSPWQCTTENPHTVTVVAGQTAEVTFVNAPRSGEISIRKVNHEGAPLAGAEFLLEWSENGTNWTPVSGTESAIPTKGTCSSADLQSGKLASGTDGWVVFSGLYPGLQYRLTETKAPDGYQLLTGYAFVGALPLDGNLAVSLTVVNAPTFVLPATGSHDIFRIPLWTALCVWACAALLVYRCKQQGE